MKGEVPGEVPLESPLTPDDLAYLEAQAASKFLQMVGGLGARGRWETADLKLVHEALEKWMEAKERRTNDSSS